MRFLFRRSLRLWARREHRANQRGRCRYPGRSSGAHHGGQGRDHGGPTSTIAGVLVERSCDLQAESGKYGFSCCESLLQTDSGVVGLAVCHASCWQEQARLPTE